MNRDLSEEFIYYRTIPTMSEWRTLKEFIPEEYFKFFKSETEHYNFEEFASIYKEDEKFRKFIDEQHFRKLIEDYIRRNASIACCPRFPHRYGSGRYTVEARWKDRGLPFFVLSDYISVD